MGAQRGWVALAARGHMATRFGHAGLRAIALLRSAARCSPLTRLPTRLAVNPLSPDPFCSLVAQASEMPAADLQGGTLSIDTQLLHRCVCPPILPGHHLDHVPASVPSMLAILAALCSPTRQALTRLCSPDCTLKRPLLLPPLRFLPPVDVQISVDLGGTETERILIMEIKARGHFCCIALVQMQGIVYMAHQKANNKLALGS